MRVAGMNINLPSNWDWAKCSQVIDVRDGTHDTPKYVSYGFPLITSKNLKSGNIDFSEVSYISEKDHQEINKRSKVDNGDILLAMIGTIGNPVVVNTDEEFSIKNVALFKFAESNVDKDYFKHLLNSPLVTRQLDFETRGGTQKFVSLKVLRNLAIPLPSLEEQKRIAAILDKSDAIRRKRKEAIALTEELLRSTFLDMFGDPVTNPKGWEVVPIKSVVSETQYGTSAKSNTEQDGLPVLRMNNITYSGEIDLSNIKWCQIEESDEPKYTTKRGDLLFNRTNSPELVGKTGVWRSNEKYAIAGYLVRVRFQDKLANSEYVSAYLNSPYGKKYLYEKAKPSNNMSNFSASEFVKIPILLAPIELQNNFKSIADKARNSVENLNTSLTKSETLFDSLLQKAFRGEL